MAPHELWNFLLVCRRKGLVKFCFSDAEMLSKIQVLIEDVSLFNRPQVDSETEIREDEEERDIVEESFSEQQDIIPSEGEKEHTSSDFPSPYSSFFSDSEPHLPTTPTLSDYDSVKNTSFLSAPISPVLRIQHPESTQDDKTREDDTSVQNLLSEQLNDRHSSSEDAIDQEEEQQENGVISDRKPTDDELEVVEESDGDETAALEGDETASLEEECRIVPSPPPSSTSAAIVLSSDDEDTNLENIFADLRLQSAKKEAAAKRVVSRKSLDMFIVSDSEELSEEEEDGGKENQSPLQRPPYMFDDLHNGRCYTPVTYTPPACSTPAYLYTPKRIPSVATVSTVHTPSATKSVRYNRYKMATELYQLFNKTVFDGKLPKEMEIVWNSRLRTTAGFCSYSGSLNNRAVKIELSTKVCDSYERIRDTIIHEMCHAANWVIDGTKRAGHGKLWKAWAKKANTVHPDINTIDRCHSYEISYKYSYQCTVCDFKIGRHSKSINLETARCPYCANCLELCY